MASIKIEELPWRDMESAPRDGTIFPVCFHPWDVKTNPLQIQAAQWLVSAGGLNYDFRSPHQPDTTVYAKGWLTWDELNTANLVAEIE